MITLWTITHIISPSTDWIQKYCPFPSWPQHSHFLQTLGMGPHSTFGTSDPLHAPPPHWTEVMLEFLDYTIILLSLDAWGEASLEG